MASTLPNMKKVPYNFKHFSETATIKCLKREREKGEHSGGVATQGCQKWTDLDLLFVELNF